MNNDFRILFYKDDHPSELKLLGNYSKRFSFRYIYIQTTYLKSLLDFIRQDRQFALHKHRYRQTFET